MRREPILAVALALLAALMAYSFLDVPWQPNQVEGNQTDSHTIARTLFVQYPAALYVIALLLAASMVGGVYLAKMEGKE